MESKEKQRELFQEYIAKMRPVLNKRALFSDETEQFRTPFEPDPGDLVTIRFRTLKNNVSAVYFISGALRQEMKLAESRNGFDYYIYRFQIGEEPVHYYFEVQSGKLTCYYNKLGVTKELQEYYSFGIVPGFHTPAWARGAVIYQIYVDRFCNGDRSNDVLTGEYFYIGDKSVRVEDWEKLPDPMDVRSFYGGDLQGVMDKLDYLQDLGVEVLYLNPIFVSPSNHKYDIQDYDYVDPHFGRIVKDEGELLPEGDKENRHAGRYITRVTAKENLEASNQLLIELIEEIHRRGMKLILDGVFNHCGSFNKWLDREQIYEEQPGYEKGAFVAADSPYHNFFQFHNEHNWPYNEFYDGWWGHDTLPKLNYEGSKELEEYILQVGRKWVSAPFYADGWRLDVAADLGHSPDYNHRFWKKFRQAVKEANPNAIILAEHYGSAKEWLGGDEWDTVMNYDSFMEPVSWFLTGMEKHSDAFREDLLGNSQSFVDAMHYNTPNFYGQSLQCAMNELSNHDHSRFLTRTNHVVGRIHTAGSQAASEHVDKAVLRQAVVIQMTWPGAPTIYYGDEAGVCGFTDPDNRRTYPWGKENRQLIQFHRDIIRLHKHYEVLKSGSVKFLFNGPGTLSYGRFSRSEQIVVAVNTREEEAKLLIPVWELGMSRNEVSSIRQIFLTDQNGYSRTEKDWKLVAGMLNLSVPARGSVILYRRGHGPSGRNFHKNSKKACILKRDKI